MTPIALSTRVKCRLVAFVPLLAAAEPQWRWLCSSSQLPALSIPILAAFRAPWSVRRSKEGGGRPMMRGRREHLPTSGETQNFTVQPVDSQQPSQALCKVATRACSGASSAARTVLRAISVACFLRNVARSGLDWSLGPSISASCSFPSSVSTAALNALFSAGLACRLFLNSWSIRRIFDFRACCAARAFLTVACARFHAAWAAF